LLGLGLIQIAIGIGIDLFSPRSVGFFRFPHLVPSSAQPTQHRRHSVEFSLATLTVRFVQRFPDGKDVLYGGAFQSRTACNLEIPPASCTGRLAVTLGNVQRYRLAGAQPLIPRRAMDAL
jgi:hypothetical protein